MKKNLLPPFTLVIGGASSGKTVFAEGLVTQSGLPRIYVATAEAHDDEMAAKIAAHRAARGCGWETLEAPLGVAEAVHGAPAGAAVLVDCATLWLTNLMLAELDIEAAEAGLLAALAAPPGPVVVVTNETGQGIVPENALARRFRAAQGRLNQALARQADLVVAVIAGLPLVLKGELP